MPVARSEPPAARVIAHLDLDCFYVQVEQRRHPELKGKPTAVVMYNPWKSGGIIAVGYEARAAGVTRSMRGDDARKVCPEINLVQVPTHFGKADLTCYRDAGSEVVAVFSRGGVCERASIDEVYLDITEAAVARLQQSPPHNAKDVSPQVLCTHIVGLGVEHDDRMEVKDWLCRSASFASRSDQLLACGAMIIAELRTTVQEETGFTTSAGIAHNKILAKLASGMHKPAQQTLIPSSGTSGLLASLPVKKLKGLGGKLGKTVETDLEAKTIGDLLQYSESKLQDLYGTNTGTWLWRVARGISGDEVEGRTLPKSHGCGKTFPGPKALKDLDSVAHWFSELSGELQERLDVDLQQNNRSARLLVCHAACHLDGKGDSSAKPFPSKSCAIRYGQEKIAYDALMLFKRALREFCPQAHSLSPVKSKNTSSGCRWGVTALSLGANNIIDASGTAPITRYFSAPSSTTTHTATRDDPNELTPPSSPSLLSILSPLGTEDSAQRDRFGKSLQSDTICTGDLEVTMSPGMDTGASLGSAIEGLDKLIVESIPNSHSPHEAGNTDMTVASPSAYGTYEAVNRNVTYLLKSCDDSRHAQSCTAKESAFNGSGNGAVTADNSETDLLCTPKFGVLGLPAGCLTVPELREDLSSVCSDDLGLVQPTLAENPGLSLFNLSCKQSEILTIPEVITCSPVELGMFQERELGSNCFVDNCFAEGIIDDSEWTTSSDQVNTSPRRVHHHSPTPEAVPHKEISKNRGPSLSPPIEDNSKTMNSSTSTPRSSLKSKPGYLPGSTMSQREVASGSSKRFVFQRVDVLWEKSRPNTQPASNSKKSNIATWNYKEDEIDEDVLSELPYEIQHELRNQFGRKRPKTVGRPTISDFFKINSSMSK